MLCFLAFLVFLCYGSTYCYSSVVRLLRLRVKSVIIGVRPLVRIDARLVVIAVIVVIRARIILVVLVRLLGVCIVLVVLVVLLIIRVLLALLLLLLLAAAAASVSVSLCLSLSLCRSVCLPVRPSVRLSANHPPPSLSIMTVLCLLARRRRSSRTKEITCTRFG